MKIGYCDTDPAGGMIPMTIKLDEENIPFEKINPDNLESMKEMGLAIVNYLSLPHVSGYMLQTHYEKMKKVVELSPDTKFLIMVPGDNWAETMHKKIGTPENVDYVANEDVSKLTEILEESV